MPNNITGVPVQPIQQVAAETTAQQIQSKKPVSTPEPVKDTVNFSSESQKLALQKSQAGSKTDELGESLSQQATEARAGKR